MIQKGNYDSREKEETISGQTISSLRIFLNLQEPSGNISEILFNFIISFKSCMYYHLSYNILSYSIITSNNLLFGAKSLELNTAVIAITFPHENWLLKTKKLQLDGNYVQISTTIAKMVSRANMKVIT